jgi:hypothetical protein
VFCGERRGPDDAAFINAEIIMATPPKRPASTHDPKIRDGAIRRMLRTATGHAARVRPDPHSIDSNGKYRAKPITLAPMPWDADKRG